MIHLTGWATTTGGDEWWSQVRVIVRTIIDHTIANEGITLDRSRLQEEQESIARDYAKSAARESSE